MNSYIK